MIRVQQLRKQYQMGDAVITALAGIDLHIEGGEYVAIMGPSGSGKSTLMNVLGCLDQADSGQYWLNGAEVAKLDDDALAAVRNRHLGFVFQSFHLQARKSALENVMLPLRFARVDKKIAAARALAMLTRVGLAERATHTPSELSGGQRQRVAIARALVNDPKIIFADEPTGALDSHTSAEIMALFAELHQAGQTIVVVTHEDDIAQHAQRIIRLRDGAIKDDSRVQH